ncbi:MAG: hypothetical protein QOG04_488 [Actinomycetota bacterium]|jgi:hypothetical protein|nr:hypothetical protein [Actinomycetota bacterium]
MKKTIALLASIGLIAMFTGTASAGAPKPVKVFEDAAGDADNNQGLGQSIPGGLDLLGGTIKKASKTELEFQVSMADMPPSGGIPEAFRFIWEIASGSEQFEFTVKSLDVGKPDVVATAMGQSPNGVDRAGNVYQGVARLEQCGAISLGITWSQCTDVSIQPAVFDTAAKTITWTVKLADLKAKAGTIITGGTGPRSTTGCQICWVAQYAERSLTPYTVIDFATQAVAYKIPK